MPTFCWHCSRKQTRKRQRKRLEPPGGLSRGDARREGCHPGDTEQFLLPRAPLCTESQGLTTRRGKLKPCWVLGQGRRDRKPRSVTPSASPRVGVCPGPLSSEIWDNYEISLRCSQLILFYLEQSQRTNISIPPRKDSPSSLPWSHGNNSDWSQNQPDTCIYYRWASRIAVVFGFLLMALVPVVRNDH